MDMAGVFGIGIIVIIYFIILLASLGLSIFLMILFIKLALRGIKALDIYIAKNDTQNRY